MSGSPGDRTADHWIACPLVHPSELAFNLRCVEARRDHDAAVRRRHPLDARQTLDRFHAAARDLPSFATTMEAYAAFNGHDPACATVPLHTLDDLEDYLSHVVVPASVPDRVVIDVDDAVRISRARNRPDDVAQLCHLAGILRAIDRYRFDALADLVERHRGIFAAYFVAERLTDRRSVDAHAAQSELAATLAHAWAYGFAPNEIAACSGPDRIGRLGERARYQRAAYERIAGALPMRSTGDNTGVGR